MFGGILEVTKESEEIYAFHIPSSSWRLIDMNQGPCDLAHKFTVEIKKPVKIENDEAL